MRVIDVHGPREAGADARSFLPRRTATETSMSRRDAERARTRMWRFRRIATRYVNPVTRRVAATLPAFGLSAHRAARPDAPIARRSTCSGTGLQRRSICVGLESAR